MVLVLRRQAAISKHVIFTNSSVITSRSDADGRRVKRSSLRSNVAQHWVVNLPVFSLLTIQFSFCNFGFKVSLVGCNYKFIYILEIILLENGKVVVQNCGKAFHSFN